MIDLPLMTYVATMSVTPGPNNLMLAASGVNFGFRRTLPHILGISIGHGLQVLLVGGALAWVMAWLNTLRPALVAVGCGYLLWLAWRQAHAGQPGSRGQG
ncbi:MAG TPA: LysE family transporter [Pseudothauera hydrothermalis]|nr:LysE family transporter [Pseudothauera hydrothermalis]